MSDSDRRRVEAAVRLQYPMLRGSGFEHMVKQRLAALAAAGGTGHRVAPPRPDHSDAASAPYRFVPYNAAAIAPAQPDVVDRGDHGRPNIAKPLPDGLCARIRLSWVAETPLLIGAQEEEGAPVTPVRLGSGERAAFIIPGASIRGAVRAVAEIAAAARLSQVNRNRLFALRDFNHAALRGDAAPAGAAQFPVSVADKIKAGWLSVREDFQKGFARLGKDLAAEGRLNDAFQIAPCAWHSVEADAIGVMGEVPWDWRQLPPRADKPSDGHAFSRLPLLVKYKVTGATRQGRMAPASREYGFRAAAENSGPRNRVEPDPQGQIRGHLVFSGPAPAGKRYEYVLEAPHAAPILVTSESMLRFRALNSQAVDDKLKPLAGWDLALEAMVADPTTRIPVFYVGDLVTQPTGGANAFFFGLTRFFKVPHRWAFGDVLNASGVKEQVGPYTPRELDMVEALFGFVREPEQADATTPPDQLALRGRVAFSAALLAPGHQAKVGAPIATVMVGPKPSFAPFYLAPDARGFRDYSAETVPRIAGRKRYPPRHPDATPADALPAIAAKLRRQIENVTEVQRGRPPDPKMLSHLCFLLPSQDGAELRFTSEVRLTNVTKEELGLVLWALTFGGGERGGACRHMLGHAKPFGAGQMRLVIDELRVTWNRRQPPEGFQRGAADVAPFLAAFETRVREALGDDTNRKAWTAAVEALRATADPAKGQAWEKAGKLDTMIVARKVSGGTVQSFQRLRDMVKPEFRGGGQAPRDPVRVEFLPVE